MNRKLAAKIHSHHVETLRSHSIPFRTTARGNYMMIRFDLNFKHAEICRFDDLESLMNYYFERMEACDCHLEINYHYLNLGNVLFDEEADVELSNTSTRFSGCLRPESNDVFSKQRLAS